jgi:hypothetical protein
MTTISFDTAAASKSRENYWHSCEHDEFVYRVTTFVQTTVTRRFERCLTKEEVEQLLGSSNDESNWKRSFTGRAYEPEDDFIGKLDTDVLDYLNSTGGFGEFVDEDVHPVCVYDLSLDRYQPRESSQFYKNVTLAG